MQKISYARHRFPPEIIQHVVWLYFRFPLSHRDVEDLLAERGIDVSYGHCHINFVWSEGGLFVP
jgi:transposase-like protein